MAQPQWRGRVPGGDHDRGGTQHPTLIEETARIVQAVQAVQAVQELKAAYCHRLDTKDWAGFRDLLADDLIFWRDSSPAERSADPVCAGADAFVAGIRRRHDRSITVHHVHNPEIRLVATDLATGRWSLEDRIDNPDQGHAWQGYGIYDELYVLAPDRRWRIRELRLARIQLVPLPPSPAGWTERVNREWQTGTLVLGEGCT